MISLRGLILVLLLSAFLAGAQNGLSFQTLTIDDGLSQNSVSAIIQDRQGFLWFCTDDGFNRYDGYSFRVFKRSFRNPASGLSHNRTVTAWEDPSGRLWIGTLGGGVNVLDPVTGAIRTYRHDPANPVSLSDDSVYVIAGDSRGRIWLGTSNGLNRFDEKSGGFIRYAYTPAATPAQATMINCLREDKSAVLWLGTQGQGLLRLDPERNAIENVSLTSGAGDNAKQNEVNTIFIDNDSTFWLGTEAGLVHFDPLNRTFARRQANTPRDLFQSRVRTIVSDSRGNRWIGTDFGLTQVHAGSKLADQFANPDPPQSLLNGQFILSILEDRTGLIWIGTHGGIFKLNPRNQQFHSYRNLLRGNSPGSPAQKILSILEDSHQRVWLGTYKSGLLLWDRKEGTVIQCETAPPGTLGLPGDIVSALYADPENMLWIGTNSGLAVFDITRHQFRPLPDWLPSPLPWGNSGINHIYMSQSGALWFGTTAGLYRLDTSRHTIEAFRHNPQRPDSLSHDSVLDVLEDHLGVLWVATYGGGLNRFEPESGGFTHFHHRENDPTSLGDDKVYCLYEDHLGTLWIGTNSGGLNRFDRRNSRFATFTNEDGLPNNVIFGILEDEQGQLWLSTNRGLSRYNPRRNCFQNYSARDGLAGNEFLPLAFFRNSRGNMFFGGTDGLTSFRPQQLVNDTFIPPVVVTTIFIPNSNLTLDGQSLGKRVLHLSHKDSIITIDFTALSYSDPMQNQFAYRLIPFTAGWVSLGTRHEITLTNLRPGSYVFHVRGSNRDTLWNETGASFSFIILPSFWQTWWFRLLASVGLTLLAIFIIWFRHRLLSWKKIAAPPDLVAICREHAISRRELDVLRLVVQGKSNLEIEEELYISIKTVKTHLYNIYQKCNVRNRLELINFLQGKKFGPGSRSSG